MGADSIRAPEPSLLTSVVWGSTQGVSALVHGTKVSPGELILGVCSFLWCGDSTWACQGMSGHVRGMSALINRTPTLCGGGVD